MRRRAFVPALLALPALAATTLAVRPARAATRQEIDEGVNAAVARLRAMPETAPLFREARAVLVFPGIVSAGFVVGGQYGEGAVIQGGAIRGHYSIAGAAVGLLAGAQRAGLAMFFMTEEAVRALMQADGWQIGTGPAVTFLDRGVAANVTSTTLTQPVYAITFGQEGLMAALALEGTKITRIER